MAITVAQSEQVERILRRYKEADSDRGNWKSQWEDCARYGAPRRMGFMGERAQGDRRITPQIYNPIGIQCVQTLAAALHGMMMNPALKWLNIRLADDEKNELESAKQWCGAVSRIVANALSSPQVSFHTHANQLLEDLASIGTGLMYCGQQLRGPNAGALYVRTHSIATACVAENEYGQIDTVMREHEYTVRQLVDIWGNDNHKSIIEKYDKGKYDDKFKVINSIAPRAKRDPKRATPRHMPIEVYYIMEKEEHLLEETGVEEMPYVIPRWWVATGEVYGRSPLMTALPQIKVSNVATKTVMDAAEKAVSPAITVPHQAVIGPVRTSPNSITYLKNKAEIGQMPTSSQLPYAAEYIQAIDNGIRTTMFVDVIQFAGDFKMTATEVIQRQTERMRLLGPVLGRLENEFLNPMVTRVFGIMARLKLLPRPPDEIQGATLRIEYQSPLARAQKSQMAQGFQQALMLIEPLAKLGPTIAEKVLMPIDFGQITPALFDWFGVDDKLLRHKDITAQEQQMSNMRTMLSQAPPLAKAAKDAAAGIAHVTKGGKTSIEASALANQIANALQAQQPPPNENTPSPDAGTPPVPETVTPPAGAPVDLAGMAGAALRGMAQGSGGTPSLADFLKAFQGVGKPQ